MPKGVAKCYGEGGGVYTSMGRGCSLLKGPKRTTKGHVPRLQNRRRAVILTVMVCNTITFSSPDREISTRVVVPLCSKDTVGLRNPCI